MAILSSSINTIQVSNEEFQTTMIFVTTEGAVTTMHIVVTAVDNDTANIDRNTTFTLSHDEPTLQIVDEEQADAVADIIGDDAFSFITEMSETTETYMRDALYALLLEGEQ